MPRATLDNLFRGSTVKLTDKVELDRIGFNEHALFEVVVADNVRAIEERVSVAVVIGSVMLGAAYIIASILG